MTDSPTPTPFAGALLLAEEGVRPESINPDDYLMVVAFKKLKAESLLSDQVNVASVSDVQMYVTGATAPEAATLLVTFAAAFAKQAILDQNPYFAFAEEALAAGVPPQVLAEFFEKVAPETSKTD